MRNVYSENPAENWAINQGLFAARSVPLLEEGTVVWHVARFMRLGIHILSSTIFVGGMVYWILGI